jgi:zinc protease
MNLTLKPLKKEERPFRKGPFFFIGIPLLSFVIFGLLNVVVVSAMDVFSLNNRIQCIFEKRKDTGVVAAQIWVRVGSKYEQYKIAGITHFIEHLIFKGTEKLKANEMASRIESLGGSINAFTSYDNTVYHIVIPKKAFEEGLEMLIDAVRSPSFPEGELAKEKKVILEEIKMGEDGPQRKLFKELFSLSYEGDPYGRPIIGYEDTVKGITRDDIKNYFKTHYRPENMTFVIVGDFNEKKARELIEKHVAGYDDKNPKTPVERNVGQEKRKDRVKIIEKDVRESYLAFSYPIPPMVHEDIPSLEVLGTILGEGESSRLQEQLKNKKGLVTNISTYLFTPKEAGLFIILATFKGKEYGSITEEIDEEVKRLLRDGATEWEIEKAKNMIRASYIYGAETAQGRAREMGNFQTITDDPHFLDKYLRGVDKVTKEDVKRVLVKYISGKDKSLVVLLPKGHSNPHTFELNNGFKYVINRNQASPSFSFRISFVGGLKEETEGKSGIFNLLSKMLLKGTKDKDGATIAREIDLLAGDMSPFSGKNVFGMSGKFQSKDIKKVFVLLKELLTSTILKEEELKRVKREVLSDIRQRDDDPITYIFRRFNEVLYEGHPYEEDPIGREDDIDRIELNELEGFYRNYVSPKNAVLAVSGDVDEKELVRLIDGLFSEWKGRANVLQKKVPAMPVKREVHVEKNIVQTHMIFGFLGPGILDKDRHAIEVMDAILSGMGGRIHKILREEKPYAYALTFFNQMAYETGGIGIYIGTDKRLTKEVEHIVRAEIEKIIKDGFTDKEVEDAKNYLVGNHYVKMQSNSAISTSMSLDTVYGLKPDYFKVWPKLIEMVKKEDVNMVAKKYLSLEKMIQITIGTQE